MSFNVSRLEQYLQDFKNYIKFEASTPWHESSGLCGNDCFMDKEGYKDTVYKNARQALDIQSWSEESIGKGEIKARAIDAVDKAKNLVFYEQKSHFSKKCNTSIQEAEDIIYKIYCGNDDRVSFDRAVAFFGAKYDLIAYLFFLKDQGNYLPICPGVFDNHFEQLGIDLKMSRKCSGKNYFAFIEQMKELRNYMEDYFHFSVSLLEAHSAIWMMESVEAFARIPEEARADEILKQKLREGFSKKNQNIDIVEYGKSPRERHEPIVLNGRKIYRRDDKVAFSALIKAGHQCEFDNSHQSFIRKNSNFRYMEPHHLVPMSQSEKFPNLDIPENIICLCSNCHNEIHYGRNAEEMIKMFYERRKAYLEEAGICLSVKDLLKMY